MAQVSKRIIAKDVQKRIATLFIKSITSCCSVKETKQFLFDILTPTEQIMLAKEYVSFFSSLKEDRMTTSAMSSK